MTTRNPTEPGLEPSETVGNQGDTAETAKSSRRRGRPITHGLSAMRRTLNQVDNRVIDGRTGLGRQLAQWKSDLVRDLGGDVSTQQTAIIDLAVDEADVGQYRCLVTAAAESRERLGSAPCSRPPGPLPRAARVGATAEAGIEPDGVSGFP